MDIEIGPKAYVALGLTIFGAATTIAWMIWQLIDALRHG